MDECIRCEAYVRERITELRMRKNVSEHRMSLELGKSGSYIRGITSGTALPSLRELFNIIAYFDMSPSDLICLHQNFSPDSTIHLQFGLY